MSDERDEHRRESTVQPVRFPRSPEGSSLPVRRRRRTPLLALAALILVGALVIVFAYLPDRVAESGSQEEHVADVPSEPIEPAERPLTRQEFEALREKAQDLLAELLEQRNELEARSVASWGGEDWAAYRAAGRLADDAYLDDDMREAVAQYESALQQGEFLFQRSQEIMTRALDAGEAAIAAGNPGIALTQFDLVLTVDPDHTRALRGKERAAALPDVLDAMRRGDAFRQEGNLDEAAAAYREALSIDRNWEPASTALNAVTANLAEARFDNLLAEAYRSLDEGRFDASIERFDAALAIRPDSEAAQDGLTQAEERRVLNSIVMAEVRGAAFERRELWDQAIDRYREALEVDPTLSFAIEGIERAQYRADLAAKLDALIESPRLLLDDTVIQDAKQLLAEAKSIEEPGPGLVAQTDRLAELIDVATTPISVTLVSDNATQVTVYRVGELGMFEQRELRLRPGQYTAIGARRGYRDVRRTFTVLPGRDDTPIPVVCEEPI
jgi:tetratricopeptide (TPR) repeat protein